MKTYRLLIVLTLLNLALLVFQLAQMRPASAQDAAPVLHGRALQIVDEQGTVRASVTVSPTSATYPDNVVFRLHDRIGKPVIKLETHEAGVGLAKGAGLGVLGDSDDTQAFIGAESSVAKVELKNHDGQRHQIRP